MAARLWCASRRKKAPPEGEAVCEEVDRQAKPTCEGRLPHGGRLRQGKNQAPDREAEGLTVALVRR